jgi:hypothetical protein
LKWKQWLNIRRNIWVYKFWFSKIKRNWRALTLKRRNFTIKRLTYLIKRVITKWAFIKRVSFRNWEKLKGETFLINNRNGEKIGERRAWNGWFKWRW